MTGGGRGFCSPWGIGRGGYYGAGLGRGGRFGLSGRGFGAGYGGRGLGYGAGYPPAFGAAAWPPYGAPAPTEDLVALQEQVRGLQDQLSKIEQRMRELNA